MSRIGSRACANAFVAFAKRDCVNGENACCEGLGKTYPLTTGIVGNETRVPLEKVFGFLRSFLGIFGPL
uniref:DB domain-containing protein n=1 Tax=Panagrellus redivivus TaxID=6233 RepID=A0A7E4VIN3_PANRE